MQSRLMDWMDGWMIVPLADLSYLKIDQFLIDGVL
jgi:hypothetical protein